MKFQTYKAETLVHPSVEPVPIVKKHYDTQLERFKALELAWEVYERIFAQCRDLGIDYMTTPFDLEILDQMAPHMPAVKIASGDLTYHELIEKAAATGKPIFLSTGMSTNKEVAVASALIPKEQRAVLHCASVYPLPDEQANLSAIRTMTESGHDAVVGYSDHTIGPEACVAAVALGARILEKHFTLDTTQVPGDHVLSLDPEGMKNMVDQVNRVNDMLGDGVKQPASGEGVMQGQMRRGLYAARDLDANAEITEDDLLIIRPETEFKPYEKDKVVGSRTAKPIGKLEPISASDLC